MFRRREGRGTDTNNETRMVKNLTNHPITLGDIDNVELPPGKSRDLLKFASLQRISASVDLKTAVQSGFVQFKDRDNKIVKTNVITDALIMSVLRDLETTAQDLRDVNIVTGDYTFQSADDVVLVNATATITLPDADELKGHKFYVKNIKLGGTVTVDVAGGGTIDGELTQIITEQYTSLTFISDGNDWFIV